jgi:hypothetical protein
MSWGVPSRCSGTRERAIFSSDATSVCSAVIITSVGTYPGAMPLTRIAGASSTDIVVVKALTPALAAE